MSKAECVKRARSLNHQAIADELTGNIAWADRCRVKRDLFMQMARGAKR